MKKVYLDTSIILYAFERKIDIKEEIRRIIHGEIEIIVIDSVTKELKKVSKKSRLFLDILKSYAAIEEAPKGHVDDVLLKLSKGNILATQDAELKQKALKEDIRVITVRQGKYLVLGE